MLSGGRAEGSGLVSVPALGIERLETIPVFSRKVT